MKTVLLSVLIILLLLHPAIVSAHQPRVVGKGNHVEIKKPEVSQAFYAELTGQPDIYSLTVSKTLEFYLSILVPDLPDRRIDFEVNVVDGNSRALISLPGSDHDWKPFFEPFVADRYLQGPEKSLILAPGRYQIVVSNPDNNGKYVLSVGRSERFTLTEILHMVRQLPAVKAYFNKSPLTAFFNLVGLFLLLALLLMAAILYGLIRLTLFFRFR